MDMNNIVVCLYFYLKKIGLADDVWLKGQGVNIIDKRKIIYLCLMYRGHKIIDIARLARKNQGGTISFALYKCAEAIMLGDEITINYALKALDTEDEVKKAVEVVRQHYLKDCINRNINIEKWSVLCEGKYFGKFGGVEDPKKAIEAKTRRAVKTNAKFVDNVIRLYTGVKTGITRIAFCKEVSMAIVKYGYKFAYCTSIRDMRIFVILLNKEQGSKIVEHNGTCHISSADAVDGVLRLSGKFRKDIGSVYDFQYYICDNENRKEQMTLYVLPSFLRLKKAELDNIMI